MTDYFPTRFQTLRDHYNDRLSSIRRASIAAMKIADESRADAVYETVRSALTRSSLGELGERERRVREHLSDQMEAICLSWQQSGEVLHDVAGELHFDHFVSDDALFADPRDGQAFPGLTYIHFGDVGLASSRIASCFIDGFFTQQARVGEQDGNMLTFTCAFDGNVEQQSELGPLLTASSRMLQAWVSYEDDAEPTFFGDPDWTGDPIIHHAISTAAASVRIVAERVRSVAFS
jgi:hypothetical protein